MEKLYEIWDRQAEFNKNFDGIWTDKTVRTKEMVLHLLSESDELLREINWKVHRSQEKNIIISNLKEEWIDIYKYWLSIGQIWGFTPEDFVEEFNRKSGVVEQRYKQEKVLGRLDNKKVVAIDIDGVLADYPDSFLKFANEKFNMNWELSDVPKCFDKPSIKYDEIKDAYRQSGLKRFLDLKPNAKEFLDKLKDRDYTIVLLTARPYKKYSRIFADTQEWLIKNNLIFDSIIWDERKNERVVKEFPGMKFMIEDSYSNAKKIADLGYKVYWYKPSYEEMPHKMPKNIILIKDLMEVFNYETS